MLLEIGAIAGIAYSWKLGTIAGITGTVIFGLSAIGSRTSSTRER
jgi:hypothetical protein